jgi:formylglycine-generating enzyme required for sulfatase activity
VTVVAMGAGIACRDGRIRQQEPVEKRAEARQAAKTEPAPPARALVNQKDGLTYILIPAGSFDMGCSPGDTECFADGKRKPGVRIEAFRLGETDVTQSAFERVMATNPSHFKGAQRPVDSVTWNEAATYCSKIGGRLPTEAEWEYAARAGTTGSRYGDLDSIAWYHENSGKRTHEVKQKAPNAFGLYDMLGNVYQWMADWDEAGTYRSLRGGAWDGDSRDVRVSLHGYIWPDGRYNTTGFRCAME